MIRRRFSMLALLPSLGAGCALPPSRTTSSLHEATLVIPGRRLPLRAWVALPPGYDAAPAATWPLVVFLHGSGERGDDLQRVLQHGLPRHAAAGREYPFVLLAPQLDAGQRWNPTHLHAMLDVAGARWRIDRDRVGCTGLSLGGHGTWHWAAQHPGDLAAIAPVCGFGDPASVCRARHVPVRAYHGDADRVVPIARQQACVDALRACGGDVTFTVYPGVGHDAWVPAYDDAGLVPWLLQQRRRAGGA